MCTASLMHASTHTRELKPVLLARKACTECCAWRTKHMRASPPCAMMVQPSIMTVTCGQTFSLVHPAVPRCTSVAQKLLVYRSKQVFGPKDTFTLFGSGAAGEPHDKPYIVALKWVLYCWWYQCCTAVLYGNQAHTAQC